MDSIQLAGWHIKAAPALFRPYKALKLIADLQAMLPNSGTNAIHIFSMTGACLSSRCQLTSPQDHCVQIINAILTVYLETTLECVIVVVVSCHKQALSHLVGS